MRNATFVLVAAAAVAWSAAPAQAQFSTGGKPKAETRYTEEERKREAEADRIYQDVIRSTRQPTENVRHDPWGQLRQAPQSKPARGQ